MNRYQVPDRLKPRVWQVIIFAAGWAALVALLFAATARGQAVSYYTDRNAAIRIGEVWGPLLAPMEEMHGQVVRVSTYDEAAQRAVTSNRLERRVVWVRVTAVPFAASGYLRTEVLLGQANQWPEALELAREQWNRLWPANPIPYTVFEAGR